MILPVAPSPPANANRRDYKLYVALYGQYLTTCERIGTPIKESQIKKESPKKAAPVPVSTAGESSKTPKEKPVKSPKKEGEEVISQAKVSKQSNASKRRERRKKLEAARGKPQRPPPTPKTVEVPRKKQQAGPGTSKGGPVSSALSVKRVKPKLAGSVETPIYRRVFREDGSELAVFSRHQWDERVRRCTSIYDSLKSPDKWRLRCYSDTGKVHVCPDRVMEGQRLTVRTGHRNCIALLRNAERNPQQGIPTYEGQFYPIPK